MHSRTVVFEQPPKIHRRRDGTLHARILDWVP